MWVRLVRFLLEICHILQWQRDFVVLNIIKRECGIFNDIKLIEDEIGLVITLGTRNTEISHRYILPFFFLWKLTRISRALVVICDGMAISTSNGKSVATTIAVSISVALAHAIATSVSFVVAVAIAIFDNTIFIAVAFKFCSEASEFYDYLPSSCLLYFRM